MAVSRVENNNIDLRVVQSGNAIHRVGRNTYTSSNAQTTLSILASVGILLYLSDVLIGEQTDQFAISVNYGQLLDLVLQQNVGSVSQIGIGRRNQTLAGHHLLDLARHIALETQVAVGNDTDQNICVVHNGDTADFVVVHQFQSITYGVVLRNSDRIVDHTILCAFNLAHLSCLSCDTHILMNHTDTTLASDGNSQFCFGYGIHCSRNNRSVKTNVTSEFRGDIHFAGQYFRVCRNEEHVVERQALGLDSIGNK